MPSLHAAALTIEITQGVEGAMPIAIVPFGVAGGKPPAEDIAKIVSHDLASTGRFDSMDAKDMLAQPTNPDDIKFQNWRLMQREALVIGRIEPKEKGNLAVSFWLFDVYKAQQIAAFNVTGTEKDFRALAHKISDIIYEKLTGQRGAFSTRIAYITGSSPSGDMRKKEYSLWIADADGYNEQRLLKSKEPILSTTWSPNGEKIAYVSLERDKQSRIVVQDWKTGGRQVITVPIKNARQSAPAWSPDGKKLVFANHKNGNTDIYVLDLSSKKVSRLTSQLSIETEPTWTPDGKSIIFTSDRSGRPQLYKMPASGGRTTRITFEGVENAKPAVSPDGKKLAMVHAIRNASGVLEYKIAVMELKTGHLNVLTDDGRLDESPSFAPNGSMIIYATTAKRHGQERGLLAAVAVDGSVRQILNSDDEVWEPTWSPFNNK
jgi:TolB protein